MSILSTLNRMHSWLMVYLLPKKMTFAFVTSQHANHIVHACDCANFFMISVCIVFSSEHFRSALPY